MHIALLFGGVSNEHAISCRSAENVYSAITEAGHRPVPIYISKQGTWHLLQGAPKQATQGTPLLLSPSGRLYTDTGRALPIDVVFPCIHGQYGEDGTIQGLLEALGIPYIGCGVEASVLGMNKLITKQIIAASGVPTLPAIPLTNDTPLDSVPLPAFCKATRSGSSIGTALARTREELEAAIRSALAVDGNAFAEPFVEAREVEVAVFDDGRRVISLPGEICKNTPYYDYESKYLVPSATSVVASLPQGVAHTLQKYAARIFDALGCRHLARVDFFLVGEQIYFNEINTMPGFTRDSLYPAMMEGSGILLPELIDRLARAAR